MKTLERSAIYKLAMADQMQEIVVDQLAQDKQVTHDTCNAVKEFVHDESVHSLLRSIMSLGWHVAVASLERKALTLSDLEG